MSSACSIGKAYLYGLGAAGQIGVEKVLELLKEELERDMALLGCRSVTELTPELIRPRVHTPAAG